MCPLSGMMQFFIVVVALLLLCQHAVAQWTLQLKSDDPDNPYNPILTMDKSSMFEYKLEGPEGDTSELYLMISSVDEHIATPDKSEIAIRNDPLSRRFNAGTFNVTGNFLGFTQISAKLAKKSPPEVLTEATMNIKVKRQKRPIDTAFTSSVATLVSIIYINFGCALNWGELRTNLKRPVGPCIAAVAQFLVMPLLSFALGKVLFPDNPEMQLGMFFTGVSPGGGASNVWVAVLDGNIDLSITMTSISTFAAFGMIPFWIFTLGKQIFDEGDIQVPYMSISSYAIALVIPLAIGYLIQRFFKKVANFFVRILKVFSSLLILFIIIFAIVSNLYLFELFSWQIIVAGMGLPWLGYVLAFLLAKIFRQNPRDCLTIGVETGIQNTGIAILLLRAGLPQPEADLTTVVPVSVAIMTPIPLMFLFLYQKLRTRCSTNKEKSRLLNGTTPNELLDVDNNTELHKDKNTTIATIS